MRPWRWMLLITIFAFVLAPASGAWAANGCDGSGDTAAADQYCESLPTADGDTDVTQRHARPLASVLPAKTVAKLEHAGTLGAVVLALPAGVTSHPTRAPHQQHKSIKKIVNGLLPGPGVAARAIVSAAGGGGHVDAGFEWALVLTLLGVSGMSIWRTALRTSDD